MAVSNQKGGTGKTTTTANLGIALAAQGKKVLLIDADPQGDLTTALGWKDHDELDLTLASHIDGFIKGETLAPDLGILRHAEGVDLMPANIELAGIEQSLFNAMNRERAVKSWLDKVKGGYDYALIDCMPSLGMLTINALTAADSVVVPVKADYLSAKAMTQLMKTVHRVKSNLNPDLKVSGILLTLVDARTNLARNTATSVRSGYGEAIRVFKSTIPQAVSAAEASQYGKSIFAHDKSGKVADAYMQVAKEVVRGEQRQRQSARTADVR